MKVMLSLFMKKNKFFALLNNTSFVLLSLFRNFDYVEVTASRQ